MMSPLRDDVPWTAKLQPLHDRSGSGRVTLVSWRAVQFGGRRALEESHSAPPS
jgi:hypothetical protein